MTGIRTIFAVIPAAQCVESAIAAYSALPLADRSKLVGLHITPIAVSYGLGADIALAGVIAAQIEAADAERKLAEAAFEEACAKTAVPHEWRTYKVPDYLIAPQAGSLARAADLIICPALPVEGTASRHNIEEVVFTSGRPVLAIPAAWSGRVLGERIVIAWDGGREAARAVFDAMPLLLKSKQVRIVSVEGFLDEPARQFTPGDDVATTLSRHGIRAESHAFRGRGRNVREELQAQVLDTGADLVVMGCYGHSRLREMILGGVSRGMLKDVPFPLLLSN
jgi:nucleotide-binding universal stress UspA family protein